MAEYKPTITYQIPGEQPVTPETNTNTKKTNTIEVPQSPYSNAITITDPSVEDLQSQFDEISKIDDITWSDDDKDGYTYTPKEEYPTHPSWSTSDKDTSGNQYKYSFVYNGQKYFTNDINMIPHGVSYGKYNNKKKDYYFVDWSDSSTFDLWQAETTKKAKEEALSKAAKIAEQRKQLRKQMTDKQAADAKAAADAKTAAQAAQAKSFPNMSFAEYATDDVYDNDNSTARELVDKAKAEGMTKIELLEAIQGTKWTQSRPLRQILDNDNEGWADPNQKAVKEAVETDPEISNELANVVDKTSDQLSEEEKEAEKKAKKEARKAKNKEAWGKFLKGDAEKYQEFLSKTNPNLVKAVFGNSGITLADRLAGLGEILATLTANTANGIYAGVNKTGFSPVQGKMSKIYNNAAESEMARRQARLEAVNKSKIDTDEIMSYIRNTTALSKLPEEKLQKLASLSVGKELSKEEFIKQLDLYGENSDVINTAYDDYKYVHKMWQTGTERYKGNLENVSAELDITSKQLSNIAFQLNTEQQLQDYINGLERAKADIKADILKIKDATQEEYFKYIEKFLGYLSGTETMANQAAEGKTSGWDFNANAKVGYGPIGAQIGGGANSETTANTSLTSNVDVLKKYNIPVAEAGAANWVKDRQQYVNGLTAALNEQLKELQTAIDEAKARKEKISGKVDAVIDDGIVKAPHMKQWIVREDGTKIRLNPGDNIYATKKKITSLKDNGKDVVPMKKEDRAVVLQKKLGYTGNGINKDFGYYSAKLV